MSTVSATQLVHALRNEAPGGCFYIFGPEDHLREELVTGVVAAHLDPATRDFNFDALRGSDAEPEALASLLATPPMMATWRVVLVRDAQGLSARARDAVLETVAAPPAGLALVLSAAVPSGSKANFYSELQKHCTSVEVATVDAMDAPGWLMEEAAERHGLTMSAEAARALVGRMGTDLAALSSELGKLAAFVLERREITLEDVRAVSGSLPQHDRWGWFDAVGERRWQDAMRQLPALLDAGESGVGLVIGISSQLLRLGIACAGGQSALEQQLNGRQRWLARRLAGQARGWTVPQIDAALGELLRTDRLLKSASLSDRQAVEELLLRLTVVTAPRSTAA